MLFPGQADGNAHLDIEPQRPPVLHHDRILLPRGAQRRAQLAAEDARYRRFGGFDLGVREWDVVMSL